MITRDHYKDDILYRCNDCGEVFDHDEMIVWEQREYRGECWGRDCYETMTYTSCPYCNGDDFERYFEDDEEEG
jgi:hypothetical protein